MRHRLALAVGVAAATAALVVVGRWEHDRQTAREARDVAHVYGLVDERLERPTAYRLGESLVCLVYGLGENTVAFEVCFDRSGRLLEVADRREAESRTASLRFAEERSPGTVPPARITRILRATVTRALSTILAAVPGSVDRCSAASHAAVATPGNFRHAEVACRGSADHLANVMATLRANAFHDVAAVVARVQQIVAAQADRAHALASSAAVRRPEHVRFARATRAAIHSLTLARARLATAARREPAYLTWGADG